MTEQTDVLVLGGAGVDTIVHVPELPLPFADSHMIRPGIETRAGQSGDFVSLGLHALGLRTHHLDMIGDDHEGDLVRALHRDRGIPLTAVPAPGGTKRAVNLVGPDGRRLSLYDATRSRESDRFDESAVRALAGAARHAHVVITQPCALVLPVLREAGVTISTDLHNWDGVDAYHEAFALQADVVFLSTTALDDPERTMRDIAARGRARTVVATAGAEGSYLLYDSELTHTRAPCRRRGPTRSVRRNSSAGSPGRRTAARRKRWTPRDPKKDRNFREFKVRIRSGKSGLHPVNSVMCDGSCLPPADIAERCAFGGIESFAIRAETVDC